MTTPPTRIQVTPVRFTRFTLAVVFLLLGGVSGCSEDDRPPVVPPPGAPPAPDSAWTGVRTHQEVAVHWRSVLNADLYEQERIALPDRSRRVVEVAASPSDVVGYTDSSVLERSTYVYRVRAQVHSVFSEWTDSLTVRTRPSPPGDFQGANINEGEIQLAWSMDGMPVEGFAIQRLDESGAWGSLRSVPGDVRSFADRNIVFGLSYTYRMRSIDLGDSSIWTPAVGVVSDPRNTGPSGLARVLEAALRSRNADTLESLLDSDFLFRFSSEDQRSHPTWPHFWGRTVERLALRALLADPDVGSWSVAIDFGTPQLPAPGSNPPPNTWILPIDRFDVDFTTRDESGHDVEFHLGAANWAALFVRPPSTNPGGSGPWKIAEWTEGFIAPDDRPPPGGWRTWGEAKQLYVHATSGDDLLRLPEVEADPVEYIPDGCGTQYMNADATYESAYAWAHDGVNGFFLSGCFAEAYAGTGRLCAIDLDLTQVGDQDGQTLDFYIWQDSDGVPGNLLCLGVGRTPGEVARWPEVTRHRFEIDGCCVEGAFWAGFRANWPGEPAGWYIGADLNGFGGIPLTYVAQGLGLPSGWQPVGEVFGRTMALGIGVELTDCGSVGDSY